jgi:hypothetical protein
VASTNPDTFQAALGAECRVYIYEGGNGMSEWEQEGGQGGGSEEGGGLEEGGGMGGGSDGESGGGMGGEEGGGMGGEEGGGMGGEEGGES